MLGRFIVGCICGGSVGGGRCTRISSPKLVFRGLLAEYRVVWYSPLASTNFFVGYESGFLLYLLFSSFPKLLGDL